MKNKYQEALNNVKRVYVESDHYDEEDIKLLQELINKETPMKVDKEHYKLEDCNDYDYFPVMVQLYKCPNTRCNLYKRYKLNFKEKRCPECNQLLDWGGKKNEKNK